MRSHVRGSKEIQKLGRAGILVALFLLSACFVGCKKTMPGKSAEEAPATKIISDACALITKEEIETVQESPVVDTKGSQRAGSGVLVSQCYYSVAESSRSVSLAVMQNDAKSGANGSAKKLWADSFGKFAHENESPREKREEREEKKKDRDRKEEKEEEEGPRPTKIEGVGDQAYWVGGRMGGAIYVLKRDAFIRISVGGPDTEEVKTQKSKALAEKALPRL